MLPSLLPGLPGPAVTPPKEAVIVQNIQANLTTKEDSWEVVIAPQIAKVEAEKKAAAEAAARAEAERLARLPKPYGTYANSYLGGQCTYYVASRISVPEFLGNANTWDMVLLAQGWRTGPPQVGAIAQTDAGWWGHVAVVEAVDGPSVLISEFNYAGPWVFTQRWVANWEFSYFYR